MTAEILLFSRGMRILRGHKAEDARRDRLKYVRRAAYNRAIHGGYNEADKAIFGEPWRLMHDGSEWPEADDAHGAATA